MAPTETTKRKIWVAAGGRCSVCKDPVAFDVGDVVVSIGEVAHIAGQSTGPKAPRGQSNVDPAERDNPDNLLLLCPACHRLADKRDTTDLFTEEALHELKYSHEAGVAQALDHAFGNTDALLLRVTGRVNERQTDIRTADAFTAALRSSLVPKSKTSYGGQGIAIPVASVDDRQSYRAVASTQIREELRRIHNAYSNGEFEVLAVFAFADLPTLVHLGYEIGPNIPTAVFERQRESGSWMWPSDKPARSFTVEAPPSVDAGTDEVVVIANVSGTVDTSTLPPELAEIPRWTIAPDIPGRQSIITHPDELESFAASLKEVLGELEAACAKSLTVHLLGPMPISIAVKAGIGLNNKTVDRLVAYDFEDGRYLEALNL